jgi:hypothetical protein
LANIAGHLEFVIGSSSHRTSYNNSKNVDDPSALFLLYEFALHRTDDGNITRAQILQSMEETSSRAMSFAEASCADQENYDVEVLSPYLSYPIFQAAIVQYRLWMQTNNHIYKQRIESLVLILTDLKKRWLVAGT